MTENADLLLLLVVVCDLYMVATSRLAACVRASAYQGVALAWLPLMFAEDGHGMVHFHLAAMSLGIFLLKGIVVPRLLLRAIREADVRREVEPFVSLHVSVLLAAVLVGVAFWLATVLVLPRPAPSTLIVPVALATLLLGFLILVSRRKAVTQVVGFLMIENAVFLFGQCLASRVPLVVELGILLDVFVGVFVFGIAIHHISREFDDIDTAAMTTLRY